MVFCRYKNMDRFFFRFVTIGNGCNIADRDVKQRSTVLSITTDRRPHSLTVYSMCSDRSDNIVTTTQTLSNETSTATSYTNSTFSCKRPQRGAISAEWVRGERPQTRLRPRRQAMQTSSTYECDRSHSKSSRKIAILMIFLLIR